MQALFHRKPNQKKNAKNMEKMKANDLIMLELGVQWPISIVLSPHNIRAFQFCFRHLVNVKVCHSPLGSASGSHRSHVLCAAAVTLVLQAGCSPEMSAENHDQAACAGPPSNVSAVAGCGTQAGRQMAAADVHPQAETPCERCREAWPRAPLALAGSY